MNRKVAKNMHLAFVVPCLYPYQEDTKSTFYRWRERHQRAKVDFVFMAALLYHVGDPLFLLRTAATACRDLQRGRR